MTTTDVKFDRSRPSLAVPSDPSMREPNGDWDVQNAQVEGFWVIVPLAVPITARPMPFQLIRRYAELAARNATVEETEDGEYVATVPGFEGVWAAGDDEESARDEARNVLYEWAVLKRRFGDDDLPIVEGINLNL